MNLFKPFRFNFAIKREGAAGAGLVPALLRVAWAGLLTALPPGVVMAQSGAYGYVGGGAGVIPEYEGSRDLMAIPFVNAGFHWGDFGLDFDGLSLRADLLPDLQSLALHAGPVLGYRFGRTNVKDPVIDKLSRLDDSIEGGLHAGFSVAGVLAENDSLGLDGEWRRDLGDGHGGSVASISARYGISFGQRWRLNVGSGVQFGSRRYLDSYFGIDATDAAASGLSPYTLGGGIKSLNTTAALSYQLAPRWAVTGVLLWDRIVGDAADSPIVAERGDTRQLGGGIAITWQF